MNDTKIRQQAIPLPNTREKLYVTKHIADYEPMPVSHAVNDKFSRNALEAPKRVFPEEPTNFNHKREVAGELTPEELSNVEVAANSMSFGEVYVKSKEYRYFWVKNGTKKAISVKLKFTDPELASSYQKPQVIPSGGEAGFELVFSKDTLGDFKTSVKYLINDRHEF